MNRLFLRFTRWKSRFFFFDNFVEKQACLPVKLATVSFEELKIICKIRIVYV